MKKTKILYLLIAVSISATFIGCGGAKISVYNNYILPIRNVSIGDVSFSEIISPGAKTDYKEIKEGTYQPTFWSYFPEYDAWFGFRAVEKIKVEEGGFLAGDNEYTWTLTGKTMVESL